MATWELSIILISLQIQDIDQGHHSRRVWTNEWDVPYRNQWWDHGVGSRRADESGWRGECTNTKKVWPIKKNETGERSLRRKKLGQSRSRKKSKEVRTSYFLILPFARKRDTWCRRNIAGPKGISFFLFSLSPDGGSNFTSSALDNNNAILANGALPPGSSCCERQTTMAGGTHQSLEWFDADHGLPINQHGRVFESRKVMNLAEKSESNRVCCSCSWCHNVGGSRRRTRPENHAGVLCRGRLRRWVIVWLQPRN